jgi:anti-sigma regulatory factor (Ser/Thr protein kinase)
LRLEHPDKFVTAFVGVFDPIGNTLTYASAGQPPPILRRPDRITETLAGTGLPLGLRSNAGKTRSTTIPLPNGSALLLYTDGLTEFDRAPLHGENRLRELFDDVEDAADDHPARAVVERMVRGGAAHDDVAAMVLRIGAPLARDAHGRDVLERWSVHTDDMVAVAASRRAFADAFLQHGATLDDVATAELVYGELVGNAVRYAPGPVDVIADWSGPDPVLHVLDAGPGFRHIAILPPDLMSESGRGLFIVSALTHDFRVAKGANGGSHACAVLRMRSRQLVDLGAGGDSGMAGAFGELIGFMTD